MARRRGGAPVGAIRQRPRPHPQWAAPLEAELALEWWLRRQGLEPVAAGLAREGRSKHGVPRQVAC